MSLFLLLCVHIPRLLRVFSEYTASIVLITFPAVVIDYPEIAI